MGLMLWFGFVGFGFCDLGFIWLGFGMALLGWFAGVSRKNALMNMFY